MAYLKPPAFTSKVFNKLAMKTGMSGTETLAVPGRSTGELQMIPVIPVDVGGTRYIVSTRGESEWVRNVRTAGAVEIRNKQGTGRFRTIDVPESERLPIIDAYRAKAGRTVAAYWKKLPDPADHPVFRLVPAQN